MKEGDDNENDVEVESEKEERSERKVGRSQGTWRRNEGMEVVEERKEKKKK